MENKYWYYFNISNTLQIMPTAAIFGRTMNYPKKISFLHSSKFSMKSPPQSNSIGFDQDEVTTVTHTFRHNIIKQNQSSWIYQCYLFIDLQESGNEKNKLVKSMKSVNRNKHRSKTQVLWTLVFFMGTSKTLISTAALR